jgi:hypothetical protein
MNTAIFSLFYSSNLNCSPDGNMSVPNSSFWSRSLLIIGLTNNIGTHFKSEVQREFHVSDPVSTLKEEEAISKQRNSTVGPVHKHRAKNVYIGHLVKTPLILHLGTG